MFIQININAYRFDYPAHHASLLRATISLIVLKFLARDFQFNSSGLFVLLTPQHHHDWLLPLQCVSACATPVGVNACERRVFFGSNAEQLCF